MSDPSHFRRYPDEDDGFGFSLFGFLRIVLFLAVLCGGWFLFGVWITGGWNQVF